MKFEITLKGKVVATFDEGVLTSEDPNVLEFWEKGVEGFSGGALSTKEGGVIMYDGVKIFTQKDPEFLAYFVEKLWAEGYETPIEIFEELAE